MGVRICATLHACVGARVEQRPPGDIRDLATTGGLMAVDASVVWTEFDSAA